MNPSKFSTQFEKALRGPIAEELHLTAMEKNNNFDLITLEGELLWMNLKVLRERVEALKMRF